MSTGFAFSTRARRGISVSKWSPLHKSLDVRGAGTEGGANAKEEKGPVTMETKTNVPLTEPGADEASRSRVMAAAPEERFHSFGPAVASFGDVNCGAPIMTSRVRSATRRETQYVPFEDSRA